MGASERNLPVSHPDVHGILVGIGPAVGYDIITYNKFDFSGKLNLIALNFFHHDVFRNHGDIFRHRFQVFIVIKTEMFSLNNPPFEVSFVAVKRNP